MESLVLLHEKTNFSNFILLEVFEVKELLSKEMT